MIPESFSAGGIRSARIEVYSGLVAASRSGTDHRWTRTFFSTAALASYPISAMTKLLAGVGFVTDFEESQWDLVGGLEFRLGGFRLSVTGRTLGEVTESALDLRLYYFF